MAAEREEALITRYSGVRLRMDHLDRVPLWRGDSVGLNQLWSDYSQYLYLPRLRDSGVLIDVVRQGVALLTPPTEAAAVGGGGATTAEPAGPPAKTRLYGRVSVQPVRMLRDLGDIADAIVAQLGRSDAEVTITVEIEANAKDGFDDDVRRTVSENARTLKVEAHEFEEG